MNTQPLITIGISFYNAEAYLADAIKSVIVQTYQNWELILIDDGSTDNSLLIANQIAQRDSRIRIISDGMNKKLATRLNQIIIEAKGYYIARMDADDLMHSERLEKQLKFLLDNTQYDLVSTSLISIRDNNEVIGTRTYLPKKVTKQDALLGQSGILHASILAKASWYRRNTYNESTALAQDYELWLKAAIKEDIKVGFLTEYLYYYREEGNVTKQKMIKGYNTQIAIINRYYEGILTARSYKVVMLKFNVKKLIVKIADSLNLMHLILQRRSNKNLNSDILQEFRRQLTIIKQLNI